MTESEWLASADPAKMLAWRIDLGRQSQAGCPTYLPPSDRKLGLFVEACEAACKCGRASQREGRTASAWAAFTDREDCVLTRAFRAALLRDLIGNPFAKLIVLNGGAPWAAIEIARAAHAERLPDGTLDPARLAVLSDAMEEAGCVGDVCDDCGGEGECYNQVRRRGQGTSPGFAIGPCRACGRSGRTPHPLLEHLRSPGPHVRGCWAVDLVLGRS